MGWSMCLSKEAVVKFGSGGVNYHNIFEGVEPSQLYDSEWGCDVSAKIEGQVLTSVTTCDHM